MPSKRSAQRSVGQVGTAGRTDRVLQCNIPGRPGRSG